jgi:hypothetical protein
MLQLKGEDLLFLIVKRGKSCRRGKRKGIRRESERKKGGRSDEESEDKGEFVLKKLNTTLLKAMSNISTSISRLKSKVTANSRGERCLIGGSRVWSKQQCL